MSRIAVKQTEVFTLAELSEEAQQTAHQKWVEMDDGEPWQTYVYEDFERIANILGVELDQRRVDLIGGGTRYEPTIWYSGFWSQGDGACFEGAYRYAVGSVKAITEHCGGKDVELIRIATVLREVQAKHNYKLRATVKQSGPYYHRHATNIEVVHSDDPYRAFGWADEKAIVEALRDLMLWLYRELESAYEHATSFEAFKEACEANQYEFTANGRFYV